MHEEVLSTLDNRTKEFIVGLVIASFNDHLSHFSDLEKSIVGQPIIPSPSKTMPLGRATSSPRILMHEEVLPTLKSSFASDTKETFEVKIQSASPQWRDPK